MKIISLLIALATGFNAGAAEQINFHQALQRALEKSPRFATIQLAEKNAILYEKNAWVSILPAFDLQASHTYTQQGGSDSYALGTYHYPFYNQAGLTISENLYDNGDTWRQAEIAGLNRKVEDINLESGRSRLLVDVAKAYYDYSAAAGAVELQRQQIESLRTQFRTIEGRYKQGLRSNRDYLQIKAQLQSSEIGLLTQQINLDNSRAALGLAIGEAPQTIFLPYDASRTDLSGDAFSEVDPDRTYEFQLTKLQEKISEIKYTTIQRTEWPRLSLRGNYNYVVPEYVGTRTAGVDDPFWNLQAMLVLDFHLWDWGKTPRTVEIADNQKGIENNVQRQTRIQVLQNLESLQKQSALLQSSFQMSVQILKANEEAYRSLNRGYVDGKVTYLELITALNDLFSSRSQDLNLRFNILKLRAELAYAQGKVDDAFKNL